MGEQVLEACKPGSVPGRRRRQPVDGHPSGRRLAPTLKQPTRGRGGRSPARLSACVLLFGLAPSGVWLPPCHHGRPGALTARFHPCLCPKGPSAVCFCAAIRRPAVYPRNAWALPSTLPMEPGLSSQSAEADCAAIRPPALLAVRNYSHAKPHTQIQPALSFITRGRRSTLPPPAPRTERPLSPYHGSER